MKNQTVFLNDGKHMVKLFNIIGTKLWVAEAWERADAPMLDCGFSTITFHNGQLYGLIGTNPDKGRYDHLPACTKERSDACLEAFDERYEQAYSLIFEAFPWVRQINHKRSMGEIMFSQEERQ